MKNLPLLLSILLTSAIMSGCSHKPAEKMVLEAPPAPVVPNPSPFEATMIDHRDDFAVCYDRFHAKKNHKAGDVITAFEYNSKGKVTHTAIQSSTLKNPKTEKCLLTVIKRIKFPKPEGGTAKVTYPFQFTAKEVIKTK